MQKRQKNRVHQVLNSTTAPQKHNKLLSVYSKPQSKRKRNRNSTMRKIDGASMSMEKRKVVVSQIMEVSYRQKERSQDKKGLEIAYFKITEELYQTISKLLGTNKKDVDEGLKKVIPWSILYFLGSVVQKIKSTPSQISYLQFIDQCIKVFRRSSLSDITEFINLFNQSFKNPQNQPVQMPKMQHQCKINQKQQQWKAQASIIEEKTPQKVKVYQQDHFKDNQTQKQRQDVTQMLVRSGQKWLKNIPVTSSIQSKKVSLNEDRNPTISSQANSPIQRIQPSTAKQPPKQTITPYTGTETTTILSKISTNINKISQNLQLPPPSPKMSYAQPHNSGSMYRTQLLHHKYNAIGKEPLTAPNMSMGASKNITRKQMREIKENIRNDEIRYDSIQKRMGYEDGRRARERDEFRDDRIDKLTARVQDYINRNTVRIQANMRDASRLRRY